MPTNKEKEKEKDKELKKRGRKNKDDPIPATITTSTTTTTPTTTPTPTPTSIATATATATATTKPLILLHLKCSLKDIPVNDDNNNNNNNNMNYYNINSSHGGLSYDYLSDLRPNLTENFEYLDKKEFSLSKLKSGKLEEIVPLSSTHHCFWCTTEFNNPSIHLPKHYKKNEMEDTPWKEKIKVYGEFCSAECAYAYLLNEKQDFSIFLEKKMLFHYLYPYTQEIKPAPNPFYTLAKYHGDKTIQEYRSGFHPSRHQTLAQIWNIHGQKYEKKISI